MEKDTKRICIANEASAMGRKSVSDDGENAHEVGGKRKFERNLLVRTSIHARGFDIASTPCESFIPTADSCLNLFKYTKEQAVHGLELIVRLMGLVCRRWCHFDSIDHDMLKKKSKDFDT